MADDIHTPCDVCHKRKAIAFFDKAYCGRCYSMRKHEEDYRKERKEPKRIEQWQLEDEAYRQMKMAEDRVLQKPKKEYKEGAWHRIFSIWKSKTETLQLFKDDNGSYHMLVYGGVHKTQFDFEDQSRMDKTIRQIAEASGHKPNTKRKNGRAYYYV